jgi:phage shock protein A
MDKWEQKIAEKEARGQALKELSSSNKVDAQFAELDKQGALEDELAALKASTGASSGPRLIEAKEASSKTQIDENLPMVVEVIDPEDEKGKK